MKNQQKARNLLNDVFIKAGIEWGKAYAILDDRDTIIYEFEISPQEFLQFAEKDLQSSDKSADKHSLINALANAKRAIDAQSDIVLNSLGIKADILGKPKHQLLNELGFVAPRIIKKIRDTRNLLEHEYKAPTKSQVEDAIDVATLYIATCSRMLFMFPERVLVFNEDVERDSIHLFKTYVSISADWVKENFKLTGIVNLNPITKPLTIRASDDAYFLLVRLFVATQIDMQVNDERSVVQVLNALPKFLILKQ